MQRFSYLIVLVLFLTFATMLAGSFTNFGVNADVTSGVATGFTFDFAGLSSALGFFFDILFFQVSGIPSFINLLVFWPLTIGLLIILLELATEILNAVVPF